MTQEWNTDETAAEVAKVIVVLGEEVEVDELNAENIKSVARDKGIMRFIVTKDEAGTEELSPAELTGLNKIYIIAKEKKA
jgi:hypothetical protein